MGEALIEDEPTYSGKPNIILQNMPGAGSLTAANYIYGVAKPDGLTIGFVTRVSISISSRT